MKHVVQRMTLNLFMHWHNFYKQFLMHNKEQNIAQIFSLTFSRLYLIGNILACPREHNFVIFVSHGRYVKNANTELFCIKLCSSLKTSSAFLCRIQSVRIKLYCTEEERIFSLIYMSDIT